MVANKETKVVYLSLVSLRSLVFGLTVPGPIRSECSEAICQNSLRPEIRAWEREERAFLNKITEIGALLDGGKSFGLSWYTVARLGSSLDFPIEFKVEANTSFMKINTASA